MPFVLFFALLGIMLIGSLVRRPDTFPHEDAWVWAKIVFLVVSIVALSTVYVAALFAYLTALWPEWSSVM
ncbi:MAG: hypothetical protein F4X98_14425 [Gammaproteobacteria bacterium]|nr:hypothetical protein [Gammaproteobacteria bacterium]